MIEPGKKMCDHCKEVVAVRGCLFYKTVKGYITVRGDDVVSYANWEDNTVRSELHICKQCWRGFWGSFDAKQRRIFGDW